MSKAWGMRVGQACPVRGGLFSCERVPGAGVGGEKGVGFGGAGRGGVVVGEVEGAGVEGIEDGGDEGPGGFDLVGAGEECGVASHDVEEEAFVGVGWRGSEGLCV